MRTYLRNPKHREGDSVRSQRSQEATSREDEQQDDKAEKSGDEEGGEKEGDG